MLNHGRNNNKLFNVAVCVSGGGTNLRAILEAVDSGVINDTNVSLVVSSKEEVGALDIAREHGIETLCIRKKDYGTDDDFSDAMISAFEGHDIDLVVFAGYLVIAPEKLVRRYKNQIINIHPSLIPAHCGDGYYGLHVHESVLSFGNKVTGATVHFVDEQADHGPIILQQAVPVLEGDTPEILQRRVMEQAEWQILSKAIDLIAHGKVSVADGIAHVIE